MSHEGEAKTSETTERELKLMLTASGHAQLVAQARAQGQDASPVTQINLYFDTADRALDTRGIMIRVRHKGGRYVLTLKMRTSAGTTEQEAVEVEEELDGAQGVIALSAHTLPDFSSTLPMQRLEAELEAHELELGPLIRQGTLTTHRTCIEGPSGLAIELDHSEYLGGEDWELECESADLAQARAEIEAWLDATGVDYEPARLPKIARMWASG